MPVRAAIFTHYGPTEWGRAAIQLSDWFVHLGMQPTIYTLRPAEAQHHPRWDRQVAPIEVIDLWSKASLVGLALSRTDLFVHLYPDSRCVSSVMTRWPAPEYRHVVWLPGGIPAYWKEILTSDETPAMVTADYSEIPSPEESSARIIHLPWQSLPRSPMRSPPDGLRRLGMFCTRENDKTLRCLLRVAGCWLERYEEGVFSLIRFSRTWRKQTEREYRGLKRHFGDRADLLVCPAWPDVLSWMASQNVVVFPGKGQRIGADLSLAICSGATVVAESLPLHDSLVMADNGCFLPSPKDGDESYVMRAHLAVEEATQLSHSRWNESPPVASRFALYWKEVCKGLQLGADRDED